MGTCPKCGNDNAYGDQCENCGSSLSPQELINPKSVLTGATPILKTTKHWYLPLDQYEDWLKEWLELGTINHIEHHDPETCLQCFRIIFEDRIDLQRSWFSHWKSQQCPHG